MMNAFLRGIASIFDFSGSLHRQRADEILSVSDHDAIASDWRAVGDDLRYAFNQDGGPIATNPNFTLDEYRDFLKRNPPGQRLIYNRRLDSLTVWFEPGPRTSIGEPVGFDGITLRVDPTTDEIIGVEIAGVSRVLRQHGRQR
jgi:hypothetical protein